MLTEIRRLLEAKGVTLTDGLTEEELAGIEGDFGFRFPPDLRELLHAFLPAGQSWPNWRGPRQPLLEWLDIPADGIEFDVESNDYWRDAWGEKPDDIDDAIEEARRQVALAPVLIPVYSHRFLPSRPNEAGNPVFSVHQTDVIVYGEDLASYFAAEFGEKAADRVVGESRHIEFWSDLASE
jgi:hypothetical protein